MDFDMGSLFGNQGAVGSVLGGLGTAAQIYQLYQGSQKEDRQTQTSNQYAADKLAEERRQFDLNYQLAQQKLAQGGGGGGGGGGNAAASLAAQIQAAHSRAIQGAYDSLIGAVSEGRTREASVLTGLIDRVQKAYGAA